MRFLYFFLFVLDGNFLGGDNGPLGTGKVVVVHKPFNCGILWLYGCKVVFSLGKFGSYIGMSYRPSCLLRLPVSNGELCWTVFFIACIVSFSCITYKCVLSKIDTQPSSASCPNDINDELCRFGRMRVCCAAFDKRGEIGSVAFLVDCITSAFGNPTGGPCSSTISINAFASASLKKWPVAAESPLA